MALLLTTPSVQQCDATVTLRRLRETAAYKTQFIYNNARVGLLCTM